MSQQRGRGLVRLWKLIEFLRRPRTLEECATEFGVTRRTIYRDIVTLSEVGVPVVNESPNGYRSNYTLMADAPCPMCARKRVA